jgi:hypothetical protein
MNPAQKQSVFRLSLGHAMLVVVVIAIALASLIEALKAPRFERIVLAIVFDLIFVPLMVTLLMYLTIKTEAIRDKSIYAVWIIMAIIYLILLSFVVIL